ncbi:MAG: DUF637 domain-containing protein, partial [Proteobacteria bacterium]|nr:DUF637 domain-containing protein [Pseudomonadota bacterium]
MAKYFSKLIHFLVLIAYCHLITNPLWGMREDQADYTIRMTRHVSRQKTSLEGNLHIDVTLKDPGYAYEGEDAFRVVIPLFYGSHKEKTTTLQDAFRKVIDPKTLTSAENAFIGRFPALKAFSYNGSGSLKITGLKDPTKTYFFSSEDDVSFSNVCLKGAWIEGKNITFSEKVDLEEAIVLTTDDKGHIQILPGSILKAASFSMPRGSFINLGTFSSDQDLVLDFYKNNFINAGTFGAVGKTLMQRVFGFENQGTLKGKEIAVHGNRILNLKSVNGTRVFFTALESFVNTHNIKGEDVEVLSFGIFYNKGSLTATKEGKILSYKEGINEKDGILDAPDLKVRSFSSFLNKGRINGAKALLKAPALAMKESSHLTFEHILTDSTFLTVSGYVKADHWSLTSLTQTMIKPEASLFLKIWEFIGCGEISYQASAERRLQKILFSAFQGIFINQDLLKTDTIEGFCRTFLNNGKITSDFRLEAEAVHNTGMMKASGLITLKNGENRGYLGSLTFSLNLSSLFRNAGSFYIHRLYGDGNFLNHGNFLYAGEQENPASIEIQHFENGTEDSIFEGHIRGEALALRSPHLSLFCSGDICTSYLDLIFPRTLVNKGLIFADIFKSEGHFVNGGALSGGDFFLKGSTFENKKGASIDIQGSCHVDLQKIENAGFFQVGEDLMGTLEEGFSESFLKVKGKTLLPMTSFVNRGEAWMGPLSLRRLVNEKLLSAFELTLFTLFNTGTCDVKSLEMAGDVLNNASTGVLTVREKSSLILDDLANDGSIMIQESADGKIHRVVSKGLLKTEGSFCFPEASVFNNGDMFFGPTDVKEMHTSKTLRTKGLCTHVFSNSGKAEASHHFSVSTVYENSGSLRLIDADVEVPAPVFDNHGVLHIKGGRFKNLKVFRNFKTCFFEKSIVGFQFLENQGFLKFLSGTHTFKSFLNGQEGHVSLNGVFWKLTSTQEEGTTPSLVSEVFENLGQIEARQKLFYAHPSFHGVLIAQTLHVQKPKTYSVLREEDLKGLYAEHIVLEGHHLTVDQDIVFDANLEFVLKESFCVKALLRLKKLKIEAEGPFIMGPSNAHMGALEILEDTLRIKAHGIDCRYGTIYAKGDTTLFSSQGDLQLGEEIIIPNEVPLHGWHSYVGTIYRYLNHHKSNGSYISSDGNLTLQVEGGGKLIGKYGTLYSGLEMDLRSPERGLDILSSNLMTKGSLSIDGNLRYHRLGPVEVFYGSYGGCHNMRSAGHRSEAARITCGKDLKIVGSDLSVVGNDLYVSGSVYINGMLQAGTDAVRSRLHILPAMGWDADSHGWGFRRISGGNIVVGEEIDIQTDHMNFSGTMDALKISVKSASFMGKNLVPHRSQPQDNTHLLLNIPEFAEQTYGAGQFKQMLEPQVPSSSSRALVFQRVFYQLERKETLRRPFGIPLELILQQAIATHCATLNIGGFTGQKLWSWLFQNGRDYEAQKGGKCLLKEGYEKETHPMILFAEEKVKALKDETSLAATLIIPPAFINPYQDSGDMRAHERLSIETIEDQSHIGTRLHSGVGENPRAETLLKGRRIHRETPKHTITTRLGKNTWRMEEVAGPIQETTSEGLVHIHAQEDYSEIGTRTKGLDVRREVENGNLTIEPLVLHSTTSTKGKSKLGKKSRTESRRDAFHPSQSTSQNTSTYVVNPEHTIKLKALKESAGRGLVFEGGRLETEGAIGVQETISETLSSGVGSKGTQRQRTQEPVREEAALSAPQIHINTAQARIEGTRLTGTTLYDNTVTGASLGPTVREMAFFSTTSHRSALGKLKAETRGGQEVEIPTILNVDVVVSPHGSMTLTNVQWDRLKTKIQGNYEENIRILRTWQETSVAGSKINPNIAALVGLATTIGLHMATGGTGIAASIGITGIGTSGAIAAGAANAAFAGLCSQAACSLAANGLKPDETLKELATHEVARSLATTALAGGITAGLAHELKIDLTPGDKSFGEHLQASALSASVSTALSITIQGANASEALTSGIAATGAGAIGSYGANQIGHAYRADVIDPMLHKVAHGILGGVTGALLKADDPKSGAISGAMGA